MSGICGIIHFDERPVTPESLERMAKAAAHRGPDGITFWRGGGVGFAHLTLRITPEAVREIQPLRSAGGDLVLVVDARIDNRQELIDVLGGTETFRAAEPGSSGSENEANQGERRASGANAAPTNMNHVNTGRADTSRASEGRSNTSRANKDHADMSLASSSVATPDTVPTYAARTGALPTGDAPTDAELILAAYRRWGSDCATRLVGDFAFAIWDRRRRRLFAARDPMAMRPFYFRVEPGRLLFGTEVKQILEAPGVPAHIFEPAVARHLAGEFGPLEWTFYEGIEQLAPGHALEAYATRRRTWRFWDIDPDREIRYRDEREYAEHLRELFKETVRCRLRSVRPVGVFLSGGMDSGSIASTAGRLMQEEDLACPAFRTYSWAFEELPECDERHISTRIVRHYGLDVTDIPADANWPLRDYPEHGPDRDEPYVGVYQAIIDRALATAQAHGVGVMMSGDRGDLMMGDYIFDYPSLFWSGQWQTLLKELRIQSRWRDESLWTTFNRFLLRPLRTSLWPAGRVPWLRDPLQNLYWRTSNLTPKPAYPEWVRPAFADRVGLSRGLQATEVPTSVKGFARRQRYRSVYMPMHMRGMVWSERSYARFGQSFADPWSDRRMAEFALAVPQRVLNHTGDEKRLVRQAMRGIMPEDVRGMVSKIAPTPVYERALREQAVETVRELLTDSQAEARGYIDARPLRDHYEAIRRGERDHPCFWWALTLEMWLRQYWS